MSARLPVDAKVSRIFAPYAGRTHNRCTTARRRASFTRSYFCLANTVQNVIPTIEERDTLNAAGLGEQKLTFLDTQDVCYIPNPVEVDSNQSTDAATLDIIDLTDDEALLESLGEWRSVRCQQDQAYHEFLLADQEKHDLQKEFSEMEERRKKVIHERQLRMADVPKAAQGVPLRFKYPSGIIRTRRFILSESIQILFDFVGQEEDATEYFHIQGSLSVTSLKSNMTGTLLDNKISGSQTLHVHWIQSDDPEFLSALDSNNQLTFSPLPSTVSSPGHDGSFSPEGTDLKDILNRFREKIDHTSCPTSNQINICSDYTGNVHNLMKSTLQAFGRRHFNPEAILDVFFVDCEKTSEGAVDGLMSFKYAQSSIFEGHETDRKLTFDTYALEKKLYITDDVCVIHGGIAPKFFSERLFSQLCDQPTPPATLEEIKEASTVVDAKAAIEETEESLAMVGIWRNIRTLKQKDALVQSAVDFYVEGRLNMAKQQFVEGFNTLGLLQEMRTHPDLFRGMFVEDLTPLKPMTSQQFSKSTFRNQVHMQEM
ncbi:hypothetical protein F2P81_024064 [Scophthalmus maximus]|uniref:UBX domain-containing protein n=1 Tax=Scophthalmus maximus TaxID=52904 RepID=A0A6A4RYD0_SCOMX|nr:hypothetical protein F2P81_024064 [Scophthalmus maximus]